MKKKIGFLVPEIKNCGPVNVVFSIIQNLDLAQFEVMLISIRDNDLDYKNVVKNKCHLGIYSLENYSLENLVKQIDVIHSHGYFPDKYVANLKDENIKKVTTIHCNFFKDYIQEYGFIKGVVGALAHFYYLRKGFFNHYIACSQSIKASMDVYLDKKRTLFINNGVNQGIFTPISEQEKQKQKELLKLTSYDKIYIYSGRLIRRKQVPELITYFTQNITDNSVLLIMGEGDELEKCKKKASERVLFLGHQNHPEKYYQISDFVLSMSNAEGYPMSILEAVSCGCYAFLSDIPSHREFIKFNKSRADFIDNLSSEKMKIKESEWLDIEDLSAKKMTEKYEVLYKN